MKSCGRDSRARVAAAAFLLGQLTGPQAARAEATSSQPQPAGVGSREIWTGIDAGSHNWLAYTGATYAPFGDIHDDGIKLRAGAGYGGFSARHYRLNARAQASTVYPLDVEKTYAETLIGYQKRIGELTAKALVGVAVLNENFDGGSFGLAQFDIGVKAALELWLNLGPKAWWSVDLSYADTQSSISARTRLGLRVLPTVSLGGEAIYDHSTAVANANAADPIGQIPAALQDRYYGTARLGAFARYEWFGGEISASGGVSGEIYKRFGDPASSTDALHRPSVYGTLNYIMQF